MKHVSLLVVFAVALSGCASLRHADGTVNVPVVLADAQWGLAEACSVEWVPAVECTFGIDALTAAQAIAANDRPGFRAAVKQSLVDAEARLSADSRLRPYLDVAIALL